MLKILALGNSFSQDCTTYLEPMTDGLYVRNLNIGGCSLLTHAYNLKNKLAAYSLQKDGLPVREQWVSANAIMADEAWDYVTVQQASRDSGLYETYYPYLTEVLATIRTLCPQARIVFNQTWAYAQNSTHGEFASYHNSQTEMFDKIVAATSAVAQRERIPLLRTGEVIQYFRRPSECGDTLCRDGVHLSLDYGRYIAAKTWAEFFGAEVNNFVPDGADKERIESIKRSDIWSRLVTRH